MYGTKYISHQKIQSKKILYFRVKKSENTIMEKLLPIEVDTCSTILIDYEDYGLVTKATGWFNKAEFWCV